MKSPVAFRPACVRLKRHVPRKQILRAVCRLAFQAVGMIHQFKFRLRLPTEASSPLTDSARSSLSRSCITIRSEVRYRLHCGIDHRECADVVAQICPWTIDFCLTSNKIQVSQTLQREGFFGYVRYLDACDKGDVALV